MKENISESAAVALGCRAYLVVDWVARAAADFVAPGTPDVNIRILPEWGIDAARLQVEAIHRSITILAEPNTRRSTRREMHRRVKPVIVNSVAAQLQ